MYDGEVLVGPRGPPPGALPENKSSARSGGGMATSPQGYFVITPLLLELQQQEEGSNVVVWVNRGWIPRHFVVPSSSLGRPSSRSKNTATGSSWQRPTGRVELDVVASKAEKPKFITPEHDFSKQPLRLYWFDAATLQHIAKLLLQQQGKHHDDDHDKHAFCLLTQVRATKELTTNTLRFPVQPPVTSVGEYKITPAIHAGYALTWYGLSGAGLYTVSYTHLRAHET